MNFPELYLPPVWYFRELIQSGGQFSREGNYLKKSLYNRTYVLGANGVIKLTIPILKCHKNTAYRNIEIDNSRSWKKNHWQTIKSAYGKAPYFEYFEDDFKAIYLKEYRFLTEINQTTLAECIRILKGFKIRFNMNQQPDLAVESIQIIDFLKGNTLFSSKITKNYVPYHQTFSELFIPHLSVIDLIFNEGPNVFNILSRNQFNDLI